MKKFELQKFIITNYIKLWTIRQIKLNAFEQFTQYYN